VSDDVVAEHEFGAAMDMPAVIAELPG